MFSYDEAQKRCKAIAEHPTLVRGEKIRLIEEVRIRSAREDFLAYRMYIHPKNKLGWFQRDVAAHLQKFYADLREGRRPKLVIEAPPQHGKSVQIIDFIAWLSGKHPDNRTIYGSFSDRLGVRGNLALRRIFTSKEHLKVFPDVEGCLSEKQRVKTAKLIELPGGGYFRNTTVRGSVTGETLDLGVIDDPIKGRADANSITVRNTTWEWFTDDFFSRFDENAGLLVILTRWHVDDPVGRLIEKYPNVKVCSYPAIAEPGRNLIPTDKREEGSGEALFPEHKSVAFLEERKAMMPVANWTALYQQSPYIQGGGIVKGAWFQRYTVLPKMKWRAITADTALKAKEANDYQVAQVWGLGVDGNLYLIDQLRAKFEAVELEKKFPDFWHKHRNRDTGRLRWFGIEDKASGTELIQRMRKTIKPVIPVKAIPRSIDKYTRVSDVAGYIESGHVFLPDNVSWVSDYIAEWEAFTADDAHDHDDQIDPTCDAISLMLDAGTNSIKDML